MQTDQNGEKSVLMKDNYWSSVHLSGGKEEIPLSAVEIEFHTETKNQFSFRCIKVISQGGVATEEEEEEKKSRGRSVQ